MVEFDNFGPEKILTVYNPRVGLKGFVVIDNTAFGPGKGGIRMTKTVSVDEVAGLARAMTWKCILAELPFGGAKSGIVANDKELTPEKKTELVKAFAEAVKVVSPSQYVAAPDMNMAESEMKLIAETNGDMKSVTGKPSSMGGLPHELGSTGFGVFHAALVALEHLGLKPENISFAVEGFGNVGVFASKFLTEKGCKLVAVSDSKGTLYLETGIDFKKLEKVKKETKSVVNYGEGKVLHSSEIVGIKCDLLVTAAIPDLITEANYNKVCCKLIVEGSNIAIDYQTEELLHEKGILVVPDVIANAGGVISSYVEYIGGTEQEMFKLVEEKITKNTKEILEKSKQDSCSPRTTATVIAEKRLMEKCGLC
ncbi:MAG: Glu/Leu/Phe/Val dehydrogenase [archaeon]